MSEKKHIDRLFQEKLKNFEATPSDAVWDSIHDRLHADKRKRRVIPIWWKFAGVAALLALLITVGVKLTSNDFNSGTINPVVDTEESSQDKANDGLNSNNSKESHNTINNATNVATENELNEGNRFNDDSDPNNLSNNQNGTDDTSVVINDNGASSEDASNKTSNGKSEKSRLNQNTSTIPKANKDRLADANTADYKRTNSQDKTNNDSNSNNASEKNTVNSNKDAVVDTNNQKKDAFDSVNPKEKSKMDKLINDSKNDKNSQLTDAIDSTDGTEEIVAEAKNDDAKTDKSIEDAIADANTQKEKEEETKMNRWNISPNVAPVYFNSFGSGSTLDEQFVNNEKNSEITMSYGVGGSYAINDRLKVRAGINKVDMGYSTNNVIAFRSIDSTSQARSELSNVSMNNDGDNMTFLSTESLNKNTTPEIINSKSEGSLNQRFGFIEVPMELEYAVINKKLGINVIGGFSTLIVNENEIYSVVDGTETRIGEASNINNLSYSANLGFGINYNISDKIKVNVEPTFKYQINTFSKSSGDVQPYFIGVYTGLSYKF
ncbi:MAG: hypothetical protein ACSHXF_02500 [Aquaticitalea sp.]